MRASERLTKQEIMRCIASSGQAAIQPLAMLDRQQSEAEAAAELHAALSASSAFVAAHVARQQTPDGRRMRSTHAPDAKLISADHRLPDSGD